MDCILQCIGASSTDNFPDETIENTLIPHDRVKHRPSYWSSGGHDDPDTPETLTYRLNCDMCIVDEIKLQPFKAYFQYGHPIYSSKAVRFRMGHSKLPHGSDSFVTVEDENLMAIADENYVWTYTSPEFPMLQENVLQSFKLPRPVLCIGGIVKVELLGRVQKQEADDRYYICICHAQVRGRSLSPVFMVDTSDPAGYSVLKYLPDAKILRSEDAMLDDGSESLEWHSLVARYRRMRHLAIMNVLLGPEEFMDEDDIIGGVLMDEDDLGGMLEDDPFV
nr:F-box family protein, putative, expressed [Oryza sativa Japonica Group]